MRVSNPPDVTLLDNPIWHALATEQSYLAHSNHLAKRFPRDVAPFGAMKTQSPSAYQALAETLSGDAAALFLDTSAVLPEGWSMLIRGQLYQMVFDPLLPPNQSSPSGN